MSTSNAPPEEPSDRRRYSLRAHAMACALLTVPLLFVVRRYPLQAAAAWLIVGAIYFGYVRTFDTSSAVAEGAILSVLISVIVATSLVATNGCQRF